MEFLNPFLVFIAVFLFPPVLGSLYVLSQERKKKIAVETPDEKFAREAKERKDSAIWFGFLGVLMVGGVVWDVIDRIQLEKDYGIPIPIGNLIGESLLAIGFVLFGLVLWLREKRLG